MSNYEHRDNNGRQDREDGNNTQLFIAKGKNDGMDPRSLVDFVSGKTGTDQSVISNVKVLDAFSFFAVPHDEAGKILDFFQAEAGEGGRPLVSKAKRKKPSDGGFGGGGFRNDRPRRNFEDRNDRPRRDFGDRPRRDFGNRDNNGNNE